MPMLLAASPAAIYIKLTATEPIWYPCGWHRAIDDLESGANLVHAIIAWARDQKARTLELIVTSNNDIAINFYSRLGFAFTGKTASYRNDSALNDLEMIRSLP
jgi:GNAT superfamily N-acetyltransferase